MRIVTAFLQAQLPWPPREVTTYIGCAERLVLFKSGCFSCYGRNLKVCEIQWRRSTSRGVAQEVKLEDVVGQNGTIGEGIVFYTCNTIHNTLLWLLALMTKGSYTFFH